VSSQEEWDYLKEQEKRETSFFIALHDVHGPIVRQWLARSMTLSQDLEAEAHY